jgi:hypothetical protein
MAIGAYTHVSLVVAKGPHPGHRTSLAPHLLAEKALEIPPNIHILFHAGRFLIRSTDDQPISLGGQPVLEKILEDGDVFESAQGTLRFEVREGRALDLQTGRRIVLFALIALLVAGVLAVGAGYSRLRTVREEAELRFQQETSHLKSSVVKDVTGTPEERLQTARARIQVAESLVAEADINPSNMYWAASELQGIVDDYVGVDPKPPIVDDSIRRISEIEVLIKSRVQMLQNNYLAARAAGNLPAAQKVLRMVIHTTIDPRDPSYQWAQGQLARFPGGPIAMPPVLLPPADPASSASETPQP